LRKRKAKTAPKTAPEGTNQSVLKRQAGRAVLWPPKQWGATLETSSSQTRATGDGVAADSAVFNTGHTRAFAFHPSRPSVLSAASRNPVDGQRWIKTLRFAAGWAGDFAMTAT